MRFSRANEQAFSSEDYCKILSGPDKTALSNRSIALQAFCRLGHQNEIFVEKQVEIGSMVSFSPPQAD
jgi:hypothetical protein